MYIAKVLACSEAGWPYWANFRPIWSTYCQYGPIVYLLCVCFWNYRSRLNLFATFFDGKKNLLQKFDKKCFFSPTHLVTLLRREINQTSEQYFLRDYSAPWVNSLNRDSWGSTVGRSIWKCDSNSILIYLCKHAPKKDSCILDNCSFWSKLHF
jgi:hypothetical protein